MRVVIADDSMLVREGVARLLIGEGVEVVDLAANANEALGKVAEHRPDAVILDIRMPPTFTDEGIEAALAIRKRHEDVGVLVLSQYVESAWAIRLLEDGVGRIGYLLKDRVTDVHQLVEALERVSSGGSVIDPIVVERLVARRRQHDPLSALTVREREVLQMIAEGRSNAAIADALFLGIKTVESHVRSILQKLGIPESASDNRRVLAVLTFLKQS
jgi:DNA-binding NarL/FixJ family response regulator